MSTLWVWLQLRGEGAPERLVGILGGDCSGQGPLGRKGHGGGDPVARGARKVLPVGRRRGERGRAGAGPQGLERVDPASDSGGLPGEAGLWREGPRAVKSRWSLLAVIPSGENTRAPPTCRRRRGRKDGGRGIRRLVKLGFSGRPMRGGRGAGCYGTAPCGPELASGSVGTGVVNVAGGRSRGSYCSLVVWLL